MRSPLVRSAAALAVLAGLALTTCGGSSHPPAPSATSRPSPDPASIEAFIPTAEHFVETHRGLSFEHPVTVTLLGDAAFRQRLLQDSPQDTAQLRTTARELVALHLMDRGMDLQKALDAALGGAVSGFYDAKAKALFVRGVSPTPYVRQVLVHELTHAVQDQHFGIDRPALDSAQDETGSAFQALVEGDAVRIEDEYHASLDSADQARADSEERQQASGIDMSVIPRVLLELLVFPYQSGPDFVRAVASARGQAGVDAAFAHPPTTTAQILEPQLFLSGVGALPVTTPRAGGTVFDQGVLGEMGLALLVERAGGAAGVSQDDGVAAIRAWGGDRYVAWTSGASTCVRDAIVVAPGGDRAALVRVLEAEESATSGVSVDTSATGAVTLTSCG